MNCTSLTIALSEVTSAETPDAVVSAWTDFLEGRSDGGRRLYDLMGNELYGLALWTTASKEDACDVVQTVFLKIIERRVRLVRVRNPRAYLLQMTRSASIDLLRTRRSTIEFEEVETPVLIADPGRQVDVRRLSKLVTKLPPEQRATVYLRHYSEMSFREIGRVTGVSIFTAASRYRLATRRLRTWLGEGSS